MNRSKDVSNWTTDPKNKVGVVKKVLSYLSLKVRKEQLDLLISWMKPTLRSSVVDVGFAPTEDMVDSNFFEKNYKYKHKITAVSVEDCSQIKKNYPSIKILTVSPNKKLPFKNSQFDIATSWATLEHVGDYNYQEKFINELLRIGKRVYITTPYRGCFYEPHTGLVFLHWLPLSVFRKLCLLLGKEFWAQPSNWNPLYPKDIKSMKLSKEVNIKIYKTLRIIPSHIILYN
jgi:hypothetical protein